MFKKLLLYFVAIAAIGSIGATLFSVNGYRYPSIGFRLDDHGVNKSTISVAANTGNTTGSGVVSQYTISSPSKANYHITTADTDGTFLYLLEAGDLHAGDITTITNMGSQTITIKEETGYVNLGASTRALAAKDIEMLQYDGTQWNELFYSNN